MYVDSQSQKYLGSWYEKKSENKNSKLKLLPSSYNLNYTNKDQIDLLALINIMNSNILFW